MKKLKYLIVLIAALILPITVFAEGEETTSTESNEVKVYFFRGEGCSHCAEAEAWFQSIEEEYGNYFQVVDYETWYNQENAELMQQVAEARGEEAQGVPYIIIGNKSWNGFTESYTSEMIEQIKSEFEKNVDDRYDIIKLLPELSKEKESSTGSDILALLVILVVVGGICFGVYKARTKIK
jgi:glutaredoxin